jgi:hypothetical protein
MEVIVMTATIAKTNISVKGIAIAGINSCQCFARRKMEFIVCVLSGEYNEKKK